MAEALKDRCLALQKKFDLGQLTTEALDIELAYLSIDDEYIGEFVPRTVTMDVPAEYAEYEVLTDKEKRNVKPEFFQLAHIKNYLGHISKIKQENEGMIWWLIECKRITVNDAVAQSKINARLNLFLAGRSGRESYTPSETRSRVYA